MRSVLLLILALVIQGSVAEGVKLKNLSRIKSDRPNLLVGYGLVTGLAGTGDTANSRLTLQSMSNTLGNLGVNLPADKMRSRNVAAVMVTAELPAYAQPGDKLDVNVTSIGDARSLLGGTLLMTPLLGADSGIYALSQGVLSVGGYRYEYNGNMVQKNHPTSASIPNGALVEKHLPGDEQLVSGSVEYVLHEPDITTVSTIVDTVNRSFNRQVAYMIDPGRYRIEIPDIYRNNPWGFLAQTESIVVKPDKHARVVVNERTGTVVAGGDVMVSKASITHGDLSVTISTEYEASQPSFIGRNYSRGLNTVVVANSELAVNEEAAAHVEIKGMTTVSDLVVSLNKLQASSQDIISIMQALKTAGALHAELIIQ